jgi:hypothetical protein
MPWWMVVLLCVACLAAGALIAYVALLRYLGKGLRG